MKRLAPLLLALALAPGSSFAEHPRSKARVDVKTLLSDQAFLESQRNAPAVVQAEPEPSPAEPQVSPSDLPDPIAAPSESEVPRVSSKAPAAPAPRVAKTNLYYDFDPYAAPRMRSQQHIVLGDSVFEDIDAFHDDSLPYVINRARHDRYDDDDLRFSVKDEVHRKVSHIRRFIHRLLPF